MTQPSRSDGACRSHSPALLWQIIAVALVLPVVGDEQEEEDVMVAVGPAQAQALDPEEAGKTVVLEEWEAMGSPENEGMMCA